MCFYFLVNLNTGTPTIDISLIAAYHRSSSVRLDSATCVTSGHDLIRIILSPIATRVADPSDSNPRWQSSYQIWWPSLPLFAYIASWPNQTWLDSIDSSSIVTRVASSSSISNPCCLSSIITDNRTSNLAVCYDITFYLLFGIVFLYLFASTATYIMTNLNEETSDVPSHVVQPPLPTLPSVYSHDNSS